MCTVVSFSCYLQVSDTSIQCIRPTENGKLLATGSSCGLINILSLSEGFYMLSPNERANYVTFVEREVRREKILEGKLKEMKIKRDISSGKKKMEQSGTSKLQLLSSVDTLSTHDKTEELLDICEKEFFTYLEEIKKEYVKKQEMAAAAAAAKKAAQEERSVSCF